MNSILQSKKYFRGLSLIELLVSMVVGIILIGGTASVYLASKRSYVEVERISRITQNTRFALQMISDSLLLAGYTGELPLGNIERDSNLGAVAGDCSVTGAAAYDIGNYLIAATSDASGNALGCITDAVPLSSVLMIKNVRPMRLEDSTGNGTFDFPEAIANNNTYIISNNSRGVMFDGADYLNGNTTLTITVGGDIPNGHAWIYEVQIFYIRNDGTGTPQLSRRILSSVGGAMSFTTENLVSGVENMSLLFGLDTNADGNVDTYTNAAAVTDWSSISAIEINILTRSTTKDVNYTDNKTYNLGDLPPIVAPGDNYHRMVMQSTVSLRNPKFTIRGNL